MFVIKYYKIFYIFSGLLVLASIISLVLWQLNFGIDFKGGSLLEIEFKQDRPTNQQIRDALAEMGLGELNIQPTEEGGIILRTRDVDEETHQKIINSLKEKLGNLEEKRFESVGPIIGKELKRKTLWSVFFALAAILIYVAWAFRKVSFSVKSFNYGLAAVIALFHDVLITIGVFSFLGRFCGIEVGVPFVAALLTVLGYSVNDTVVVFDRLRENLLSFEIGKGKRFSDIVGQSIRQTLARSINTILTTLLALVAIFLFGGVTIKYFALALIIGIAFGGYSSIFVASPLLANIEKRRKG